MTTDSPPARWCVALLAGGDSDERAISLQSGEAVRAALTERGHLAIHLDPAIVDLSGVDWRQFDVAFLALHGRFGEDGQVQHILDEAGIPYTGSRVAASRLAFSKSAAKERFAQFGVPTPPYLLIHYADEPDRIRPLIEQLGYPLVIKPDSQGSSLGVSIVRRPSELAAALRLCFEYDSFGVVEQAILGTEWTVGLLDDRVLPAIHIRTPRQFFDYQAKYEDGATEYVFETAFPPATVRLIEETALEACRALGTAGLARVDLRVDDALQPWVLEVNTIPGLTDHSLVPKAAARAGIGFAELCELTIQSALAAAPRRPYVLHNAAMRTRAD